MLPYLEGAGAGAVIVVTVLYFVGLWWGRTRDG
jgi:hypothetical protein